jgi:hypothetical protein
MSKSKYCQDCGGALLNPDRCSCGWKSKAAEKESGKTYPGTCMVVDCKADTDVVTWVNDRPITRCCWHYSEDLRRAGKNQLRPPSVEEARAQNQRS